MDDELQRGLRARLAQVDERIEEYRRIVEAQQYLDALLTLRGDIAEEINEVIDDERVQVPPGHVPALNFGARRDRAGVLDLAKPFGSS